MDTKKEFDLAVLDSVEYQKHFNEERNDNRYYDDLYAVPIIKFFDKKGVVSYETKRSNRYKCTSICALASSARLCFLDFFNRENVVFEKPIYNDISASRPTKMDATIKNHYYECKCQEIVGKSHNGLSVSYLNSKYFKQFSVSKFGIDEETHKDEKTNKTYIYKVLSFDVKELGIVFDYECDYRKMHFDLKQLICHLIALANENKKKECFLTYVFYKPSKAAIVNYPKVKTLYEELEKEIEAIWNKNTSIQKFCKDNNITLTEPEYHYIDEIDDFVYLEAFKK